MDKRKLVVVKESGAISELGFISGPILTPTKIGIKDIIKMVTNGRKVFECNPANPSEEVELDVTNVKKDNFVNTSTKEPTKVETPAEPKAPVVDEKPEVETSVDDTPEKVAEPTPATPVVDEKPEVETSVDDTPEKVAEPTPATPVVKQNTQKKSGNKNTKKK